MNLTYRPATAADLPELVRLLADDELGRQRERSEVPLPATYLTAFERIDRSPDNHLLVVENGDEIVGTFQLSFLPYLTYQGGLRAHIEAVRVNRKYRGQGLGRKMFLWAIRRARDEGAHLLQLTTDKRRPDALRFYQQLGFRASHEGLKLHFPENLPQ